MILLNNDYRYLGYLFKYLGHIVTDNMTDDADIQREIRSLFVRTNILIRRFYKCSMDVKRILFKTYCVCVHDAALWSKYNVGTKRKLMSCYNKCVKMFFGYKRSDSVTKMLFELRLPSFDTILLNSSIICSNSWNVCRIHNKIIGHLAHLQSVRLV